MPVDPKFHPKIIGRRGTVVSKIRQDHEVQITMPDKESERPDVVVITGLEQNAMAARDDILRIVHDFVSSSNDGSSSSSSSGSSSSCSSLTEPFLLLHCKHEQAANGAETAAIDGRVSS